MRPVMKPAIGMKNARISDATLSGSACDGASALPCSESGSSLESPVRK
jgi:hypothetical protein